MSKLTGKRILVVGGSSGIGAATARAFADLGADVTIASRNMERLVATAADINLSVAVGTIDITDDLSVQRFFDSDVTYDHVVVSGAQTPIGSLRELPMSDAYAAMESKFWGAYRVARYAKIANDGSLTLVSGILSTRPSNGAAAQGAVNAALEALARGLALELSPVRVNTVSPGIIATPLWSKLDEKSRESMYEATAARLPARRMGQPADVANAIVYVATTPYSTGSTVVVDGGHAIV
jgi:NAD(P)-dependent dehydrogenase (short-subunit alcohol dehydrogenase family)